MPHDLMNRAVAAAHDRLWKAAVPWSTVAGPATAAVATASCLGWHLRDATTLVTHEGRQLHLQMDSPAAVKAKATSALEKLTTTKKSLHRLVATPNIFDVAEELDVAEYMMCGAGIQ